MAYRSTPDLVNLAQTDLQDSRNAKPRWQELAEMSTLQPRIFASQSRYSNPRAIAPENDFTSQSRARKSRSRQVRGDVSVRLGASRSRSRSSMHERSRSRASRESWVDGWLSRSTSARTRYRVQVPKKAHVISLLALAGLVLSWFALFGYPSAGILHSMEKTFWQKVNYIDANAKHGFRSLNCKTSSETGLATRDESIRHAMLGVLYALSESPEALDDVLDLLEKAKDGLHALHENTDSNQRTRGSESGSSLMIHKTWITPHTRSENIDALISLVANLTDHVKSFDSSREMLLKIMQDRIHYLDSWYEQFDNVTVHFQYDSRIGLDNSRMQFRKVVGDDFGNHAMVLEGLRDGLEKSSAQWDTLFEQTALLLASEDYSQEEVKEKDKPVRKSLLNRLILWSSPIDFSRPPRRNIFSGPEDPDPEPLTPAQNREQLLNAVRDIYPYLHAMQASTSKAYTSANLARTIIKSQKMSWATKLIGSGETFDEDLIKGLRETASMVPMLMDQRRGQRAERQYERGRAKREAKMKTGKDERFEEWSREYQRKKGGKNEE